MTEHVSHFPHPRPAGPPRNKLALFFSPFGRLGRVTFLLLTPLVIVASVVLFVIGMLTSEHRIFGSDWHILAPAGVLLFTAGGSLVLRRLHDIGVPGWAAPLGLLPRAGWYYAIQRFNFSTNRDWEGIALVLILLDIAMLLVLVFWPGQNLPNRHGPVPD